MWRRIACIVLLFAALTAAGSLHASAHAAGLISEPMANRLGLSRAWFTQIEVDGTRSQVAHLVLHVSATRNNTVYEVFHEQGTDLLDERQLDRFGVAIGKEGVQKLADERVQQLIAMGQNPKSEMRVVPEVTLYAVTTTGLLHAIDAETGRTRWARQVGRSNHPSLAPAVNDRYVAVVNGSILYVVDSSDGKPVWQRQLRGVPGAGPGITEALIHAPMVSGMVESYNLADSHRPPTYFQSVGRALIQPTATPHSIAWATDRGHLYVGHANERGSRYRLVAQDTITAPAAYKAPDLLYVASIDGYVYCVHEISGALVWRYSTGQPISQSPVIIRDSAYVISDHGGMFHISATTGVEQWWAPQIRRFLAASNDRVYCIDQLNRLVVLDGQTGARIGMMATQPDGIELINWQTDRIYLGNRKGLIQCLHETQLVLPVVNAAAGTELRATQQVQQPSAPTAVEEPRPVQPRTEDPFDDPFDTVDPFAVPMPAEAPPAGAAPVEDDPFADPFADPFGAP